MSDDKQTPYDPELVKLVRESVTSLAHEICAVQPMPSDAISKLLEGGKTTAELRAEGYRPVSRLGLLWVKD